MVFDLMVKLKRPDPQLGQAFLFQLKGERIRLAEPATQDETYSRKVDLTEILVSL